MAEITEINPDAVRRAKIDRSLRHPVMFFFTSGAAWLAVAVVFGLIASWKKHSPTFLEGWTIFDAGKIDMAHINTLVYGWGCQAAFGIIIWLMARLSRKECRNAGIVLVAGHLWNLVLTIGIAGILFGYGEGVPLMEMPAAVWPVFLALYFVIVYQTFVDFKVRDNPHVYISQWYLLASLFWFPWIYATAHFFIFILNGNPIMDAAIAAWFKSALTLLFFIPVALGASYYMVPKVSGRPVHSYSLAILGFWTLAVVAPWAGMQKLAGAPIPQFLPYLGAAATVMILIPALTVGVNLLKTVSGHGNLVMQSPTLRFTVAGIVGFLLYGSLCLFLNMSGTLKMTQFSVAGSGMDILAIYGVFSLAAYGAIYFIVPRLTQREWLSTRFINWHFYLSLYGVIIVAFGGIFVGLMQGASAEAWDKPWADSATLLYGASWGTTIAWIFLLFSNLFFCLHLLLMWARLGRRSTHPTLLTAHHGTSPHGNDGEVDNYSSAH